MAGLTLDTGLTGSVVGNLFPQSGNSSFSSSAKPARTMLPEGPTTVTGAAFGPGAGGPSGGTNAGMHVTLAGLIAAAVLVFIWWGLPR